MAEVVTLIDTLLKLIQCIHETAKNVNAARRSASELAHRVTGIQHDLLKVKDLADNEKKAVEHHLNDFKQILEDIERFLLKMKQTGVIARIKHILMSKKYARQCEEFDKRLTKKASELSLSLSMEGRKQQEQPLLSPRNLAAIALLGIRFFFFHH